MTRIMQLMVYMINEVGFSPAEVEQVFQNIQDGNYTYLELIDELNVESGSGTMDQLACDKIASGRWRSALKVCLIRQ